MTPLDAQQYKPLEGGPSFSLRNRVFRALWIGTWFLLCSWTPPSWSPWRVFLLQLFGAQVDRRAAIASNVAIWLPRNLKLDRNVTIGPGVTLYNMAMISIAENTIISQGAVLCAGTHDICDPAFQLISKPITIGRHVWIATQAFVGPGVVINDGAVLGARGCAFNSLEAWKVYVGNPAKYIKDRKLEKRV